MHIKSAVPVLSGAILKKWGADNMCTCNVFLVGLADGTVVKVHDEQCAFVQAHNTELEVAS
jgi:hypothetical protein